MKLLNKSIARDLSGRVSLLTETSEDIWHLYNLLRPQSGDIVRSSTMRKVTTTSSTGSVDARKIRLTLSVGVQKLSYDPPEEGRGEAVLHIAGPITQANEYVSLGSYHTLDVGVEDRLDIEKAEGEWDEVMLARLEEATAREEGAEIGAIVCAEGIANVCLITNHTTVVLQRIDVSIPRKRQGASSSATEKATERFHQQVYDAITRHFKFDELKIIIIASPGFYKDSLYTYIFNEAVKQSNKQLVTSRPKFLLLHSPSHHVHALLSLLSTPEISSKLSNSKFAKESQAIQTFFKLLDKEPLRAWYTPEHVKLAIIRGAVKTLLISDNIYRNPDPRERKEWVELQKTVRGFGGEVLVFSSMHESGEQLNQLMGVAAILNYPLDIEVVEEEEEAEKKKIETANGNGGVEKVNGQTS